MSDFPTLSLSQAIDQARNDLNGRMTGADAFVRRTVVDVVSVVWGGLLFMLYDLVSRLGAELLPDSAKLWVARHAAIWGLEAQAPTFAAGQVTVTGIVGAIIGTDAVLQRSDGWTYAPAAAVTLTATSQDIAVLALASGAAGNAIAGTALSFVSPIEQVASNAVVAAGGLTGAIDAESDDALKARTLERIRNPPQAGAQSDYERWAKEVSGVTRAWVFPGWLGAGTVGITFVFDGRDDIIPNDDDIEIMEDYLDPLRPVTANLIVFAPVADAFDMTLHITPDTPAVRAAVEAEIADMLARDGAPGGTILISRVNEAISLAAGESDHILTTPNANVVAASGHLPVPGAITWV